jgi:hypothetical protein
MSITNLLKRAAVFSACVVSFAACFFVWQYLLFLAGVDYVTATAIGAMWGLVGLAYATPATTSCLGRLQSLRSG